jgi:hypothetical protein
MLRHPFWGRSDRIRMMTNPDAGVSVGGEKNNCGNIVYVSEAKNNGGR